MWNAYSSVAHGSDCSDVRQPRHPVSFLVCYGYDVQNVGGATSESIPAPPAGPGATTGNGPTHTYDPRLYASPPQPPPKTISPPKPDGGGQSPGHGRGGGNGP